MNTEILSSAICQPDTLSKILLGYDGVFSIGIRRDKEELVIHVRIEGDDPSVIAKEVDIDGETVRVMTNTGFKLPTPLQVDTQEEQVHANVSL